MAFSHPIFWRDGSAVLMRVDGQSIQLDDQTQVEILDELAAIRAAARKAGKHDLRVEIMRRAFQLQHARLHAMNARSGQSARAA